MFILRLYLFFNVFDHSSISRINVALNGNQGEPALFPFSHHLSNRVRDALRQISAGLLNLPSMGNSPNTSCSSYLSTLPLITLSSSEECSICEAEYTPNDDIVRLPCGHAFHLTCISTWGENVPPAGILVTS